LKYLNEANSKIPIVVASGVNSISSLENAFALGAIDFIKKPLHLRELLARIKRFDILSHRFYFNSLLYFDNTKQLLIKDEKEIKLTLKQREILSLFVKYPNETITYEFLQIAVWSGRTDIKLNTISTYIRDINPVIFPSKIKNIPKVGYKLNNIQSKDKANKYL
jgi:DNA-binding response OmpR family regulator